MVQQVLLVEDDPAMAKLLTRVLRKGLAVEVTPVDNFRVAIELLATMTPSLVITDLAGPGGRGEDVVEYIRKEPRLQSVPIIVLSGILFEGAQPRLFEQRIDAALPKPVSTEKLLEAVARCLSGPAISVDEALLRVGSESKSLDYKKTIDLEDKKQRACLAKDVIAFFNSGGGSIVVGVEEEAHGRFVAVGIPEGAAQALEVTRLNEALRRYIGTELSVSARRFVCNGELFVIITVPTVLTKLAFAKDEHADAGLYPGRFYIRNEAAQSVEVRDWVTLSELFERVLSERARVR